MNHQPSYHHQYQQRGSIAMHPSINGVGELQQQHPNNHRLIMTAPRPRLQRLLSDDSSSSSSFDNVNDDIETKDIIRNNLFAPPEVAQSEIFRGNKMTASNHPQRQMIYQPSPQLVFRNNNNNIHHRSMVQPTKSILRTPPKKRQGGGGGRGMTCSKVTRTGSEQYCGLSAEIAREIAYRTPRSNVKMHQTPASSKKQTPGGGRKLLKTPVSRDLFRAKTTTSTSSVAVKPPITDNSKMMQLQLTPTASMSSASSDGGEDSKERDFPYNMLTQPPIKPTAANNKRSGGVTFASQKKRKQPKSLLDDTPQQQQVANKKQKIRKTPFAVRTKSSTRKKLTKCLTPPRNTFGNALKNASSRIVTSSAASTLLSLSTSFDGVDNYRLTSTEHDPSPFQVELPTKHEFVTHSKVCSMMDGYTAIHRDFNFALLTGVSRSTLENEYAKTTASEPMVAGSFHRNVIQKLLECEDDVVVEGFFREYTEETAEKESERIEVVILSSERLRQIIVCFRGSTANQAKPLSTSLFGKQQGEWTCA